MTEQTPDLLSVRNRLILRLTGERNAARAERDALRETVADYENRISWGVTCKACADHLDGEYRDTVRAERAEAEVERLERQFQRVREAWKAMRAALTDQEATDD